MDPSQRILSFTSKRTIFPLPWNEVWNWKKMVGAFLRTKTRCENWLEFEAGPTKHPSTSLRKTRRYKWWKIPKFNGKILHLQLHLLMDLKRKHLMCGWPEGHFRNVGYPPSAFEAASKERKTNLFFSENYVKFVRNSVMPDSAHLAFFWWIWRL